MFLTPQMFNKISSDLQKASPTNWRIFGAVALGRTKASAKARAREMAEVHNLQNELEAIENMIDTRNDFWAN